MPLHYEEAIQIDWRIKDGIFNLEIILTFIF